MLRLWVRFLGLRGGNVCGGYERCEGGGGGGGGVRRGESWGRKGEGRRGGGK